MTPSPMQMVGAALFLLALIHTFSTKFFERLARAQPRHAGFFHLLGEVEVVFGFWAMVLVGAMAAMQGGAEAVRYVESRQYTEPLFVFVVMVVAASRPIQQVARSLVVVLSRLLPIPGHLAKVWVCLSVLPLLGSFITEPAAMTVAALALRPLLFVRGLPQKIKYLALGVLFVNISIGGTLTSFAAPPVLMVAAKWNWDSAFMASTFGWKAAIAVGINATVATLSVGRWLRNPAARNITLNAQEQATPHDAAFVPWVVCAVHLLFLASIVLTAHHPVLFIGLFLLFMGFVQAYKTHQSPLILKEALLVAFFLAGLVVLGGLQQWWLQPIVSRLSPTVLFFGATALTAITDNAVLTYLGSLIDGLSDLSRIMLVAGAVTGGGLTVIANAPNPAGVALLRNGFEDETIGAGGLLLGALTPTLVAAAAFLLL